MKLELLGEHTIDTDLLTPGGWCLDAGARDFSFAKACAERGCKVVALDADPTVEDPKISNVMFKNIALAMTPGFLQFAMTKDPQARHLGSGKHPHGGEDVPEVTVEAMTLQMVMQRAGVKKWDAVKLDIEGEEHSILMNFPGPVSRQISVEFHEHCSPKPGSVYTELMYHLGRFYDLIQHTKENRYGAGMNWWDSLWILR